MEPHGAYWYRRFRAATFLCAAVAILWTLVIILPFDPFSSLLPVMIGGGAGTWFLLGYVIYLSVGVGGFAGLSAVISSLELNERRTLSPAAMGLGLVMLFAGTNATCLLLGLAGAFGGYAQSIQHLSGSSLESMLTPYVDVTRATSVVAAFGAAVTLFGIARPREEKRTE